MVLAALYEAVSMGVVMSFMGVITRPEKVYDYPFVYELAIFLNDVNGSDMMLPLKIVFVTIVISGVIRSLLLYVSTRVSFIAVTDMGSC